MGVAVARSWCGAAESPHGRYQPVWGDNISSHSMLFPSSTQLLPHSFSQTPRQAQLGETDHGSWPGPGIKGAGGSPRRGETPSPRNTYPGKEVAPCAPLRRSPPSPEPRRRAPYPRSGLSWEPSWLFLLWVTLTVGAVDTAGIWAVTVDIDVVAVVMLVLGVGVGGGAGAETRIRPRAPS